MRALPTILLVGCFSTTDPVETAPRRYVTQQAPTPTIGDSVINVPITMSLAAVREGINSDLPIVMVEDSQEIQKNVTLDLKVSRRGDLQMAGTDAGHIGVTVPLDILATIHRTGAPTGAAQAEVEAPAPGTEASDSEAEPKRGRVRLPPRPPRPGSSGLLPPPPPRPTRPALPPKPQPLTATVEAQLDLAIDLVVQISEDWAMEPTANATYNWVERPNLSLGPINVDVTRAVDETLAEKLPEIAKAVEDKIRETDDLSEKIGQAWSELSTPREIPAPAPVWLAIEPRALFISDPTAHGEALSLNAGMVGKVQTVLSETAPPASPRPLPNRTRPPANTEGLSLLLDVAVGWDALSAEASTAAAGQRWPIEVSGAEAGTFTLTGAELYPSGTSVAVGLSYAATSALWDTEGTLWVQGKPTLDKEKQEIRITDFDYTLDSWELAAVGANAETIRDLLRSQLEELLVFSFREPITEKMAEANQQLNAVDVKGGTLSAKLQDVSVQEVFLSEEALNLQVAFRGGLAMAMSPPAN
ncbi:MAG: DUF4403 family protein [Myxococcota bacterium]